MFGRPLTEFQNGRRGWLDARGGRTEYWAGAGLVLAIRIAARLIGLKIAWITVAPLMHLQIRRLHDIGRSGWWALPILLVPFAECAAVIQLGHGTPIARALGLIVEGLQTLVLVIWLGALPGDAEENRYGPPPGRKGGEQMAEAFS